MGSPDHDGGPKDVQAPEARIRTYWLFPAGLVAGAAVAWAALSWIRSPATGEDGAFAPPTATAPAANSERGGAPSAAMAVTPGSLAASPAAAMADAEGAKDAKDGKDEGPQVALADDVLDRLREFERSAPGDTTAAPFWTALANLYALTGRAEDVVRVAQRAVDAGAGTQEVVGIVSILPTPLRVAAIDEIRRLRPDAGWNAVAVAQVHVGAGDVDGAFAILTKEAEGGADPGRIVEAFVRADPERAAALLDGLATRLSWDAGAMTRIAGELIDQGENDLALPWLRRALAAGASGGSVVEMLSKVDPAAAVQQAELALQANPEDYGTWGRLAAMRMKAGDAQGAFDAYRRAAVLDPEEDDWMEGMLKADPVAALPVLVETTRGSRNDEVLGLLAQAYLVNGKTAEAVDAYFRAHEADPRDYSWLRGIVQFAPQRAADRLASLLQRPRTSGDDEVIGAYGNALLELGDRSSAFDRYLEAHKQDPGDMEWLRGMAKADPARALPVIEARRKQVPDDEDADGILGDVYAGLGKREDAIALYEKAIARDAENRYWMVALAKVAPERGLGMLRAAVDEAPNDDEAWGQLGTGYAELGRTEDARAAFDKALALDPRDSDWIRKRALLK